MEQVNPTRMELLAKRAQIALAQQGRDLLQEKRDALWRELMKTADVVMRESSEVEAVSSQARHALAQAEALDGREVVHAAGFAAGRQVSIEVTSVNVMGVHVPRIERKPLVRSNVQRGYSLASTSARIDAAAARFEEELELIVELAASEMRLRRLAEEIRKTTTRVNALDLILLPRLEGQRVYIERALDEREREDTFRLKRVKAALARKRDVG
ncbi:MAG: V-type ATP synthase subunit D [Chloroflexi bacterium]|nr:V-type ATP synthase subunit D [Chloroflexota bacterium]